MKYCAPPMDAEPQPLAPYCVSQALWLWNFGASLRRVAVASEKAVSHCWAVSCPAARQSLRLL